MTESDGAVKTRDLVSELLRGSYEDGIAWCLLQSAEAKRGELTIERAREQARELMADAKAQQERRRREWRGTGGD